MTTGRIHPVKAAFTIPLSSDIAVERFVYIYILEGDRLCLIDTGVKGSEKDISDALSRIGKQLSDVDIIILTHSHPDHVGAASLIQRESGAQVWAHSNEQDWIEDIERQGRERPVPGFAELVGGSVTVDRLLGDGDVIVPGGGLTLRVMHTPGHSSGSVSLLSEEKNVLFSGDVIPQPGGMPIYEDVTALAHSLVRLAEIKNLGTLYSSWAEPLHGKDAAEAIRAGMRCLCDVHRVVMKIDSEHEYSDPMELCRQCIQALGLPPFAANPLVFRSLLAHRQAAAENDLFSLLMPYLEDDSIE